MNQPIYETIKLALVARGWTIDETSTRRPDGELHEFVLLPRSTKRMAWIDAVLLQATLDETKETPMAPEPKRCCKCGTLMPEPTLSRTEDELC